MLVDCPECSARISDAAQTCPQYGSPRISGRGEWPSEHRPDALPPRRPPGPPTTYTPASFVRLYFAWAILKALCLLGLMAVGVVEELVAPDTPGDLSMPAIAVGAATVGAYFGAVVLGFVLLYRSWAQVQDGYHRTSPGCAVGFCFIPFFNLYWMFVAYRGLAMDQNAFCARRQIMAPDAMPGVALAYCILILCTWIPFLGLLALLASQVLQFIMFLRFANCSAAIAEALAARPAAAPPQVAGQVANLETHP